MLNLLLGFDGPDLVCGDEGNQCTDNMEGQISVDEEETHDEEAENYVTKLQQKCRRLCFKGHE